MDRVERIFEKVTLNLLRDMNEDKAWVAKIIVSCENESHLSYCPTLIDLFQAKHNDKAATLDLEILYSNRVQFITQLVGPIYH